MNTLASDRPNVAAPPPAPQTPKNEAAKVETPRYSAVVELLAATKASVDPKAGQQTQTRFKPGAAPHPRKILVADDESLVAAAVMQSLRQLGYTAVGPAHDGEHAIELAFSTLPDLAILDVRMMTDSDGIDAARAMFNELLLPVVILSAYSDRDQVTSATEAGVFGYLVKPATKDQLRPAIEVAWARFNQFMAKEIETEVLRKRLEDRRAIEQGKWALVERQSMTEPQAMDHIRKAARNSGRSMADVAREILEQK